ncbi:MAG: DciA family protein [Alphaproteobacteria bacterium]|nr:DciA family protein [Alphaproteobacteria bacterium]
MNYQKNIKADHKAYSEKRKQKAFSLAKVVSDLGKPLFRKFGFIDPNLVMHWRDIVGDFLATRCFPLKIMYKKGTKTEGILHIQTSPSAALELQHLTPQILQKLNTYLGYQAIIGLKFYQTPVNNFSSGQKYFFKKPHQLVDLDPESCQSLMDNLEPIKHDNLKKAVYNLGYSLRLKNKALKE